MLLCPLKKCTSFSTLKVSLMFSSMAIAHIAFDEPYSSMRTMMSGLPGHLTVTTPSACCQLATPS